MDKKIAIIIGLLVLALIAGGIYSSSKKSDTNVIQTEKSVEEGAMMGQENSEEGAMMQKEDSSMSNTGDVMVKAGSYEAYTPEKILKAENGDVVLFFRASWCPTCVAVDKDIRANSQNIPAGLTILDVDYDNSSTLKQKYGVTYQHTFVQVDKDGNAINKWSGSPTLASLVAEVK